MKRTLYPMALVLASFAIIPVTLIGTSSDSIAHAADEICDPLVSLAATGGAIQQQIDAIARCKSVRPTGIGTETSELIQKNSLNPSNSILANPQNQIDENRLFCPSIPLNASPDDLQYKLALERCKYGAGS